MGSIFIPAASIVFKSGVGGLIVEKRFLTLTILFYYSRVLVEVV